MDLTNVVTAGNYTTMLSNDKLHVKAVGYQAMVTAIKKSWDPEGRPERNLLRRA